LRHKKNDPLRITLLALRKAIRLALAHRSWRSVSDDLAIVGVISALEITYGIHGFHPHVHMLVFSEICDTEGMKSALLNPYINALSKCGLAASRVNGVTITSHSGDLGAYVAKVQNSAYKWGLSHELTMQNIKSSRSSKGMTMTDTLWAFYHTLDVKWASIWLEYYAATKGSKQLFISPSIKRLLFHELPLDDNAIVDSDEQEHNIILCQISSELWWWIVRREDKNEIMARILRLAETSLDALSQYVTGLAMVGLGNDGNLGQSKLPLT
jgi:hypothetical protein